jgi:hypothetical protein
MIGEYVKDHDRFLGENIEETENAASSNETKIIKTYKKKWNKIMVKFQLKLKMILNMRILKRLHQAWAIMKNKPSISYVNHVESNTVVREVCITTYMMPTLVHNVVSFAQRRLQETQTIEGMSEKFIETSMLVIPVPIVGRYSQERIM